MEVSCSPLRRFGFLRIYSGLSVVGKSASLVALVVRRVGDVSFIFGGILGRSLRSLFVVVSRRLGLVMESLFYVERPI